MFVTPAEFRAMLFRSLIPVCTFSTAAFSVRAQPQEVSPFVGSPNERVTTDAVPDTTDWRRYMPLEIGNRWEYYSSAEASVELSHGFGYEIIGDTLMDGKTYFVVRDCIRGASSTAIISSDVDTIKPYQYIRYDTTHAAVVERLLDKGTSYVLGWDYAPCKLDLPFGAVQAECTVRNSSGDGYYFTYGGHGYTYVIGSDTLRHVTFEGFDSLPKVEGWVAGIGRIWQYNTHMPGQSVLTYARIDGKEYGTKRVFVAKEATEQSAVSCLRIDAAYPNPFRDRLRVRYHSAAPLTYAALYDVLGRHVGRVHVQPQDATAELDGRALADGIYVLRVCDARTCVSHPVVKAQ